MRIEGAIYPTGSGFTKEAWCRFVASRPEFSRRLPYQCVNPFTKEAMTLETPKDTAEVMLDGRAVGDVGWSMSEEPLVTISIEPIGIRLVEEWVTALKGEFRPYPQT